MKKNKRMVAILVFGVILPVIVLILMFTFESEHINLLNKEYVHVETQGKIDGVIHSIKSRKGGIYVALSNNIKVQLPPSCNYSYEKSYIDNFLRRGDLLFKPKNSDTLYVFRNGQKYYFVLGKFINK
ncbi:hypothetical protein LA303_06965 [Candidatus Sulfidibacterium hydrothermale]|uniref:hypothetical protein n=1 Tax=Candidatus Sulfidibacterium hydrothermale TaxID=2875962 RepID=UPI001F0B3145|nr:hypothetical protein [Candidatus Sulfidibacterium hydrothermale]UBM61167.1 hypothetical protein LA303_06965 [Candidatus Sulfidibacterium hydrothermale]